MRISGRRQTLSADWKTLCRQTGLRYQEGSIRVRCGSDRFQDIRVDDSNPGVVRLWSRVASRSQLSSDAPELERPEVEAWLINRYRELVGFKVVERGTIIGEAWIPMIEVSADEWRLYVHTVAKACDRLEYLWTGVDRA
jgi:hypothetical protein